MAKKIEQIFYFVYSYSGIESIKHAQKIEEAKFECLNSEYVRHLYIMFINEIWFTDGMPRL